MRLWNLPGARRFVDRACDTLRGGSSLVISFPGAVPEGFDDTLAAELGNAFQIGNLSATASPLEDLCRQYADDRSQIQSISDLCDDLGFRNLSTTLRHRRFLFTDSFLLLWKWRVG